MGFAGTGAMGLGSRGARLSLFGNTINHIIQHWGYIAVFVMTALEGFGFFFVPGETTLIAASIYAAETGKLSIILVLAAAVCGALLGDNFAYWVGREFGFRLLRRYGHYIRLNERRLKFVQYLFLRYGHPIVFVGRFVVLLRAWEAFLAGADAMPSKLRAHQRGCHPGLGLHLGPWRLGTWAGLEESAGVARHRDPRRHLHHPHHRLDLFPPPRGRA